MSLEIVKIVRIGEQFGIEAGKDRPLPSYKMATPDSLLDRLTRVFGAAHDMHDGSWLADTDTLLVEMPDGGLHEISYPKLAA